MQCLQDPNQSNVGSLNKIRREDISGTKRREYLSAITEELETNSMTKNKRGFYRGITDFKKGYQSRNIIVNDEKGDLVADCHSVLAKWRNHFSTIEYT